MEEMSLVVNAYLKEASRNSNQEEVTHYGHILGMINSPDIDYQPDWDEVAARWLDIIRPVWYEELSQATNRPLLLKDIRAKLIEGKQSIQPKLFSQFGSFPVQKQTDKRILACIIGVA